MLCNGNISLGKQATFHDVTNGFHWFPREMTSREQAQKFHIDNVLLPKSLLYIWLVEAYFPCGPTNHKHYPHLASGTSSVWNFCFRSSDVISRGNQWCWRKGQLFSHARLTSVDDVTLKARIHKKMFCFVISVYSLTAVFPLSVTDGKLKTLEDAQRVAGLATRVELLSAFVFIMTAGARSWTSTVPAKPSPLFLCVVMALVKGPNGSTLSGRR